jgi:uncharacterized membrane protein
MKTTQIQAHKSSIGGMDASIAVMLIYIFMIGASWWWWLGYLAWIAGPLVFFMLEKESRLVKYHAVQALIIGLVRMIFMAGFAMTGFIASSLIGSALLAMAVSAMSVLVGLAITAFTVYILITVYNGKQLEIPGISAAVNKIIGAADKK